MRERQERILSALCHLFNAIPLWGLLFCGWLWFQLREESRTVRQQAQQAMLFHVLLMAGLFIWMMLEWFSRILGVLSPRLIGDFVSRMNGLIVVSLLFVYVSICIYGCWRLLSGRPFQYPLVRVRK